MLVLPQAAHVEGVAAQEVDGRQVQGCASDSILAVLENFGLQAEHQSVLSLTTSSRSYL